MGNNRRSGYRNLIVWKKADQLAKKVYTGTQNFPKNELFGLTSQIRRSALSVPTNIVEGYARKSDKELSNFLNISYGSLAETEYLLSFAYDMNFMDEKVFEELSLLRKEVGALLWRFIERIESATRH